MSLALAAKHLAARGRGNDSMLVHMSPKEVSALQGVAMAHGGSLSVNPDTGLPEAKFLESILPTLVGAGLMMTPVGAALGVAGTAGLVGGLQYARTGDLNKGLMAGLGAYGGAGLGEGLASVGRANTVVPPGGPLPGLGGGPLPTPAQDMGVGLGKVTESPSALGSFLGENKAPLIAGGIGIAGQAGAFDQPKPPKEEATLRPYTFSSGYTGGVGEYPEGYTGEKLYFRPTFTAMPTQPLAAGGSTGLESGGFVVPADVVSALGNGSSSAGLEMLASRLGARPIKGPGDGMSDSIRTSIEGKQKAAIARDEAYVPRDKVKQAGGAKRLYEMMDKVRSKAHGKTSQQRKLSNPAKLIP